MARYIDADALTAEFKRLTLGENSLIERLFADGVYAVIETFPTADVVPKSWVDGWDVELASEIFEEIEKTTARVYNDYMFNREGVGMAGTHFVVEFSDKIDIAIAELKKKYTEGEL